jgi:hypothetical protein
MYSPVCGSNKTYTINVKEQAYREEQCCSSSVSEGHSDKKENKIFLIYKKFRVAKS